MDIVSDDVCTDTSSENEDQCLAATLEAAIDADDIEAVRAVVDMGLKRATSYNSLYDMYGPTGRDKDEDRRDPNGDWALEIAVRERNASLAHELFRAGANPDTMSPDQYPPEWPWCPSDWIRNGHDLFPDAVHGGDVACVKEFLDAGVKYQLNYLVDGMENMDEWEQWHSIKTVLDATGSSRASLARFFHRDGANGRLWDTVLEHLLEYTQSSISRMMAVYAAVKLKMLAMRARERAWIPASTGVARCKRSFEEAGMC